MSSSITTTGGCDLSRAKELTVPLRLLVSRFSSGATPTSTVPHYYATEESHTAFPWVTIADITADAQLRTTKGYITEAAVADHGMTSTQPGALLLSMYASLGIVAKVSQPLYTNQALLSIYPNTSKVNPTYLYWALRALYPYWATVSRATTQANINQDKVKKAPVPLYALDTQAKIAAYLDYKIGALDAALDRAKQQLEHVKAYRQTVITDAVSPPGTPRIPLKRVTNCYSYGANPKSDNPAYYGVDADTSSPWATIADITADFHLRSTKHRITAAAIADYRMQPVPAGTLLMSMYGSMGRLARNSAPIYTNTAILAFQPNRALITDDYLYWSLQALYSHWPTIATKTTQMNLSQDKVLTTEVALPPLPLQAEIAAFLDQKVSAIDKTIATLQQLLLSLPLYRQSLISDVVTGQLAVPDDFTATQPAMLTPQ